MADIELTNTTPNLLLSRVVSVAKMAIAPPAGVSVPVKTLIALRTEVQGELLRIRVDGVPLIRDEADMLLQSLINADDYRAEGNALLSGRWRVIAEHLLRFITADLAAAGGEA